MQRWRSILKGQMMLRASISGFNPTKRTNNPITLNYTHQENMFELWNMIDYGSQFEQNLQYKLYKQLDKRQMIKHFKISTALFYFCGDVHAHSLSHRPSNWIHQKEGITINMNVVVDHNIKVEMDEKSQKAVSESWSCEEIIKSIKKAIWMLDFRWPFSFKVRSFSKMFLQIMLSH